MASTILQPGADETRPTQSAVALRIRPGPARASRCLADELGVFLLVLYFLIYVVSNASMTFEPSDSTDKHVAMVVIAVAPLILPLLAHAKRRERGASPARERG